MLLISNFSVLKLMVPVMAAITMLTMAGLALPVQAADPDLDLKAPGSASPDIAVNSDGSIVALVYYKDGDPGAVYLKSATAGEGWRTRSNPLGFSSVPPKVAFSPNSTSTVYVMWVDRVSGNSIKYAVCTLADDTAPVCPVTGESVYTSISDLDSLDLVVDTNGASDRFHLAWQNVANADIETLYLDSLSGLPLITPTATLPSPGTDLYRDPVLAVSNARMHLAFLHDNDPTDNATRPKKLHHYYSMPPEAHAWQKSVTFGVDSGNNVNLWSGFDWLTHPAIAAIGGAGKVLLTWDAYIRGSGTQYSLLSALSTNDGDTWLPAQQHYITSTRGLNFAPDGTVDDRRASLSTGFPIERVGLRPSLAISGTDFALAWQQRPVDQSLCRPAGTGEGEEEVNGSSEIYVYQNSSSWDQIKHATPGHYDTYAVAPDIAVDLNAKEYHLVYMKAISIGINCSNENTEQGDYDIYYQGPPGFMQIAPGDQGELGGPFLPVIFKN